MSKQNGDHWHVSTSLGPLARLAHYDAVWTRAEARNQATFRRHQYTDEPTRDVSIESCRDEFCRPETNEQDDAL